MSVRAFLYGVRTLTRRPFPVCSHRTGTDARFYSSGPENKPKNKKSVRVTFVLASGQRIESEGKIGDTLLDVVVNNDLPVEGFGACEGTLTCSTCHVILKPEDYKRIENEPLDEENDMLELAYGLTDTSRLGCQVALTPQLDGLEVRVPDTINDQRQS